MQNELNKAVVPKTNYRETCLIRTLKGTQNQYLFSEVLVVT